MSNAPTKAAGLARFLPRIGSPGYHLLLAGVSIFILGPLGGISAAFMNFSIGFFIGGQVLAGILGSTVTLPYGPEGKHGANYIQTMSASVAGMCAMAVLIQAMAWMGLPAPPAWQLVLYFMCMGMFGVGIGMLYTPVLVDRMQLTFPSGFAVANILRALTDKNLLKRSVAKLGSGMAAGFAGGLASLTVPVAGAISLSTSTFGAGMIVGARIALPALVVALVGSSVLHQPPFFLLVAVGLCFLFVLVNGISLGISDWNPISSAFVMTVFILAALGLRDPGVGLMCGAILLIACSEGGDMQQDRSTGWRLGTNRVVQFRYQVIGIAVGAVLAVVLARVFMSAYPVLKIDQFANSHVPGAQHWQSAMTYKFVGALRGITTSQPHVMKALQLGVVLGLAIEIARKLIRRSLRYRAFAAESRTGRVVDFSIDAFLLPSPYASSFGGFVEIPTVLWWAGGGVTATLYELLKKKKPRATDAAGVELPADMGAMSLIGGGLIAGDSLAALSFGIYGLIQTIT